jgi:peptidoglycan hydrolase-like protein with peptidoglycan-binding domain
MLVTRIYQEDMKLKGDEIPGPKLRGYLQHAMKITEPEK